MINIIYYFSSIIFASMQAWTWWLFSFLKFNSWFKCLIRKINVWHNLICQINFKKNHNHCFNWLKKWMNGENNDHVSVTQLINKLYWLYLDTVVSAMTGQMNTMKDHPVYVTVRLQPSQYHNCFVLGKFGCCCSGTKPNLGVFFNNSAEWNYLLRSKLTSVVWLCVWGPGACCRVTAVCMLCLGCQGCMFVSLPQPVRQLPR